MNALSLLMLKCIILSAPLCEVKNIAAPVWYTFTMQVIGLTGNFGTGKSTVLDMFRALGAQTFSVDDFVQIILTHPAVIQSIADLLGKKVLAPKAKSPALDKKKIADIIFSSPEKRKAVESIIHPEVFKAVKIKTSEVFSRDPSAIIIFEIPLLFEAGYEDQFARTVVVHCKRETALKRLTRKGFTRAEAAKRIRAQMALSEKKKRADYLIDNDSTLENSKKQVAALFEDLKKL
jgi:dephospho-CoA kinase